MSTNLFDEDFNEFLKSNVSARGLPDEAKTTLRMVAFAFWVKGSHRALEAQRKGSLLQLIESMLTEAVSTEGDAQ